jgi:hypothetical protein
MVKVNSVSGGQTSAYIAAHHPADYNVFALVRTNDKNCLFPDKKIRQIVSDKIGVEFIGTLEMDTIIYTILDLEQYIGKEIDWVTGEAFEDVIESPGILPNLKARYCTTEMKLFPIAKWWREKINEPFEMRIGFRANEQSRANTMISKLNENGLSEIKIIVGKHKNGNNKWQTFEWQKPTFPLIDVHNPIYKNDVINYWKDKPVRFAEINNCVGCFHRNATLLKKMSIEHPNKFQWFIDMETRKLNKLKKKWQEKKSGKIKKNYPFARFKKEFNYEEIKNWKLQTELEWEDFDDCDSGYCGL